MKLFSKLSILALLPLLITGCSAEVQTGYSKDSEVQSENSSNSEIKDNNELVFPFQMTLSLPTFLVICQLTMLLEMLLSYFRKLHKELLPKFLTTIFTLKKTLTLLLILHVTHVLYTAGKVEMGCSVGKNNVWKQYPVSLDEFAILMQEISPTGYVLSSIND